MATDKQSRTYLLTSFGDQSAKGNTVVKPQITYSSFIF